MGERKYFCIAVFDKSRNFRGYYASEANKKMKYEQNRVDAKILTSEKEADELIDVLKTNHKNHIFEIV